MMKLLCFVATLLFSSSVSFAVSPSSTSFTRNLNGLSSHGTLFGVRGGGLFGGKDEASDKEYVQSCMFHWFDVDDHFTYSDISVFLGKHPQMERKKCTRP